MAQDAFTGPIRTEITETNYGIGHDGETVVRYPMSIFATNSALAEAVATITAGLAQVADQLADINGPV